MIPTPHVHAVLLAAGSSTRFGSADKLLADVGGEPLVIRAARKLLDASVNAVVAVVAGSPEGELVAARLSELPLRIAVNPAASRGMGTSVSCGAAAVTDMHAGIMIVPGDMPSLDTQLLETLLHLYRDAHGSKIVHPVTLSGEQRNPVIWPPDLRPGLMALDGASGGKHLIASHASRVITHAVSPRAFDDIDTQDDLLRFRSENS